MATSPTHEKRFGRAVVVGGSIGGLMAARALADAFEQVIVLERDPLPEGPDNRKSVPQGRHPHVLLAEGMRVMNDFFPGLGDELREGGAPLVDTGRDLAWYHFGVWKARFTSGIDVVMSSRPFLEWHVRRRVTRLPNVEIRCGQSVLGPLASGSPSHITGVKVRAGDGAAEEVAADLVVDASGRGSRTPRWLEELGYSAPEEETVGVSITYTSGVFRPPPGAVFPWGFLIVYPRSPESWRGGFIAPVEGGRWIVSLNGYFGDHAPDDEPGFREYARTLPRPELSAAIAGAELISPLSTFKLAACTRRHYEKLPWFPEGLVVLGDAVAAFNPVFGQGMSVASLGAELLHASAARAGSLHELATSFRRGLRKVLTVPWLLSTSMDLHYPQTVGHRPFGLPVLNWYIGRLLESTSQNPRLALRLYEVLHLRRGVGALLEPTISLPVLLYGLESVFVPLARRGNVDALPDPLPLALG